MPDCFLKSFLQKARVTKPRVTMDGHEYVTINLAELYVLCKEFPSRENWTSALLSEGLYTGASGWIG